MKEYIRERVLATAKYIIKENASCRKAGAHFYVSETTIHNDMTKILPKIDEEMAKQVKGIFEVAKMEKHIRGGMAYKSKMVSK